MKRSLGVACAVSMGIVSVPIGNEPAKHESAIHKLKQHSNETITSDRINTWRFLALFCIVTTNQFILTVLAAAPFNLIRFADLLYLNESVIGSIAGGS